MAVPLYSARDKRLDAETKTFVSKKKANMLRIGTFAYETLIGHQRAIVLLIS